MTSKPVGFMDPNASFMLPLGGSCVLSSHIDLLLVRDPFGKYTKPLYEHDPTDRNIRQAGVHNWCAAAFGDDHAKSIQQRGVRMAEEAIEAAQACGVSAPMLHRLIDHIYSKAPGELSQEIGGVGVTLLALAHAANISADLAEQTEFDRVLSYPLAHFAARNEMKNSLGFNVTDETPA